MKIPFREHHFLAIMKIYEEVFLPLDLLLRNYFRAHKAIGAKDRSAIAESVYGIIRHLALLDHIGASKSWQSRYELFAHFNLERYAEDASIEPHIRVSFPKDFFELLKTSLGEKKAWNFCKLSNEKAPVTVRCNLLKTTRRELLEKWQKSYAVQPTIDSPYGITFLQKINFFALPEFKEGLFEVQDEASQLISCLLDVSPGDHILDYCAGSGGKTLAIAPHLQGKGQIYLHDSRPHALKEARERLRRAGVQNAQFLAPDDNNLKKLKGRMDALILDVPCSGTGTLRRNPDMKWKFSEEKLENYRQLQREIFEKALIYLKAKGKILYATCSVLVEENERQVDFFCSTYGLKRQKSDFHSTMRSGGMDGFFGALLVKSDS